MLCVLVDQEVLWSGVSYWLMIVVLLYVLFLVGWIGLSVLLNVVSCDRLVWPRRTDGLRRGWLRKGWGVVNVVTL